MKIGYSATFNMPNTYMPFEKSWIEEDELLHGLDLFNVTDEDLAKLISNVRKIQYAIRKQVIDFHFESTVAAEKQMGTQEKDLPVIDEKLNQEWQEIKEKILKFKYKEEAQEYLDTTSYNMTIEAKQIINAKPTKK